MDNRSGGRRRKRTTPLATRRPETRSRGRGRNRSAAQARSCVRSRPPVIDIADISVEDDQPPPLSRTSRSRSPCSHGGRRSVTRSRSRSPRRSPRRRSVAQDSASYCCCGSCHCTSPNRRSIPARIEPREECGRSRSRSQCRRDRLHPVITANGDIEIRAPTGINDEQDGVVLIHKTTNGSVIVRGLKDGCGDATIGGKPIPANQVAKGVEFHFQNASASRSCCAVRDQGTDPLEDTACGVTKVTPQKSLDLLGGVEVRFDHHTFPLSPRPHITESNGTDSYDSELRQCGAPQPSTRNAFPQPCEPSCKPTRQRSTSRSRSRERKRNRPPDPEVSSDNMCHTPVPNMCAGPPRNVCMENCRSPWTPSLSCSCLCHDPDRDVAWVSWPIFGPRIAAWIQDHRRCIVNRMRAEQARRLQNLQCHVRDQCSGS